LQSGFTLLQKSRVANEQAPRWQELSLVLGNSLLGKNVALDLEIQIEEMEMNKQNKDWLIALERERLDTSYKTGGKKPEAIQPIDHRYRDNIMFNYGRFMAGQQDTKATRAAKVAERLIKKGQ
jgi:hypothetical protein